MNTGNGAFAALATIAAAFSGLVAIPGQAATDGALLKAAGTNCVARPGSVARKDAGGWLEVTCDGSYGWPGVELKPADGGVWDLSGAGVVEVVVSNMGAQAELIAADVLPKGAPNRDRLPTRSSLVPPGGVRLISVPIADARLATDAPVALEQNHVRIPCVGVDLYDWRETAAIEIFQCQSGNLHPIHFAVLDVRTAFEAVRPIIVPAAEFFPFSDRYGQLRHLDWPGKIHSDGELAEARRREEEWLDANAAGPVPDLDRYGGWKGGPKLAATGFFRTEKVDGRWWLVDPEGHLFWSLGVTCVYAWTETRATGREKYFEWLPEKLNKSWMNDDMLVNFMTENLVRKYGEDWKTHFADTAHRRFRAWGLNTIGNWSHEYVWALRRTPYVATIDPSSTTKLDAVVKRYFGRTVPDVFSPQFAADVRARLAKLAEKIRDDPWCIGVFVDNEQNWGAPEDIPGVAEAYFSTVAAAMKEVLPNHLYLGCRFAVDNPEVWRAAARHCDVVSFNFYERRPTKDLPPDAEEKPIIVGEFHFGALDRGLLSSSCAWTFNQAERAQCFKDYVNACLDNPRYVGCHWFQYTDEALTGRYSDGESHNCGFVSVCDVPYPELVEACRQTASKMYSRRADR